MDSTCAICEAPLETPLFSKCPRCQIDEMAVGARARLEEEPWERLPERWRRLAEGWSDFPPEFQQELKFFLVETYDAKRAPRLRRATSTRLRATPDKPAEADPIDLLEVLEADIEEWSR